MPIPPIPPSPPNAPVWPVWLRPNGDVEPTWPAPAPRNDGIEPDGFAPSADPGALVVENIVARNGFAPPSAPVICGRSPTPTDDAGMPVGCVPSPGNEPAPVGWVVAAEGCEPGEPDGVVGAEGMGGRDSRSAAPNEDEGLNAFRPLKPVVCRGMGAPPAEEMEMDGAPPLTEVAPVGCEESEEKRVSEKAELVIVLDVGCEESGDVSDDELCCALLPDLLESNMKEDATLVIIDDVPLGAEPLGCDDGLDPKLPKLGNAPVCCGCCCNCDGLFWLLTPIASSMRVGGFGTGGTGVTICPNGFLDPVWCVFTG